MVTLAFAAGPGPAVSCCACSPLADASPAHAFRHRPQHDGLQPGVAVANAAHDPLCGVSLAYRASPVVVPMRDAASNKQPAWDAAAESPTPYA